MTYTDFRPNRARHLTQISHERYMATTDKPSHYAIIPGWRLGNCLHDLLHCLYLGTARDLIPSLLGDWNVRGLLGDGSLDERLRRMSAEMHADFKAHKPLTRT